MRGINYGKADKITKNDLISVAKKAGIKISEAEKCISEIKSSVSKWDEFAKEAGLSLKRQGQSFCCLQWGFGSNRTSALKTAASA